MIRKQKKKNKITIRGLHTYFGKKKILRGIDMDIPEGESMVIIGGSGAGKSVFLKSIIGLVYPTKGSIKIDQMETTGLSARERQKLMHKFGVLFQGGALFDSLRVWENITFSVARNSDNSLSRDQLYKLALDKLASVGLGKEVADLFPAALSGGMQKRVALARAIVDDPEIIFFDEPTTGLDPIMADVINNLIVKCSAELGATTVTITHDMQSARKIADRVAMMYDGKIIWEDNVKKLDRSRNPYVEQFIHGSAEGPIKMQVMGG